VGTSGRYFLPGLGLEAAPMVGTTVAWLGPIVEGNMSTGRRAVFGVWKNDKIGY
jgi:hypothetical protein